MADPRAAYDQISDGLATLIACANGATLPEQFAICAGLIDLCADLGYSLKRVGDSLTVVHHYWIYAFDEIGSHANADADALEVINARKRVRW